MQILVTLTYQERGLTVMLPNIGDQIPCLSGLARSPSKATNTGLSIASKWGSPDQKKDEIVGSFQRMGVLVEKRSIKRNFE